MRDADFEADQVARKRAKAGRGGRREGKELQKQQARRRDRDVNRDLARQYNSQ